MEDDEYKKLPLDERCVHKLWKARVNGYEEVTKLFRQIDDEKSPEFAKYLGLVKKFVTDSNAMGQEKGLEATLAFAENYANAGKTVGEVMSGIVTKCMAGPKTKTRELALQVTLTYIEIEKQDAVVEELLKGLELKNPKIVAACIVALTTALREFGYKVIQLKPVVKKIPVLFADRDKNVRDEARLLVIEMYRWIGAALKPQLSTLQPVQVTELEAEFAKIEGQKAVPTRYLRSQQEKQAILAVEAAETCDGDDDEEDEVDEPINLDPYELATPVDILSKLPKDFYDKLEAKKWQERKEALEALENLVKTPKLENGDYGDLVRALKKMIHKDSNVVVVALAAKCLNGVANGLKKRFQPYSGACIPALLEKFKEKKQNVVVALRETIDTIYLSANLENILEDIIEALGNKNPSVKTETSLFLARAFTRTVPAVVNKKILKAITGALLKLMNEPDPAVRDAAADAIGTLMKLVGERAVAPFIVELEKDANKMAKIREYCEKAVIVVKVPGIKKEKTKVVPKAQSAPTSAAAPPKAPARRPATSVKKRPKTEISSGTATIVKSKGKVVKVPTKVIEKELSDEEVAESVGELLPADVVNGLADPNWKNRLSSVESFLSEIQGREAFSLPVQALTKTLCKKPGLKDTNFQVLKARLDAIKILAGTGKFSVTSASFCLNDITEKLGDAKNGTSAGEALTAIAEATTLNHVSTIVFEFAHTQKSPKVLQETLLWLGNAIKEFGFANLNPKFIIENAKKALASNNAQVRGAAISLFGVLFLYMGHNLQMFIENEKPALREQINAEFDKYENDKPPSPIRGVVKSASSDSLDPDVEDDEAGGDAPAVNVMDLLPRSDISGQITEALIVEMTDKNWKVRNEALIKVANIISEAKLIKPNIGDLPQALALRLVDSNSKIAQTALSICESIATAMGPPCKQHVRTLFPGFLQGLGDSKAWIRTASVQCMNTFADQAGYKEFFEGEMIHDALKSGSPTLRSELWLWLSEKLPKIKQVPKEELIICIPYLYANVEDRNADVRKNANEAVLGVMIHVGYEAMVKQLEKVKPASKSVIQAQLEKVRPNLPAKPAPTKKPSASEDKVVRSGGARPATTTKTITKPIKSAVAKPVARTKKEDDIDTSPLLVVNNLKHQRTIDESKLKVLKWNFTTPRQEFVDLLRDQMTAANVNKTLIANMFHADFKYHIKAIESLSDDMQDNGQALISNLDLILKWLTLRFFDTNPSVLLKGLEYLSGVFQMLITEQYHLLENEATCFIPYLITKIGDPKDAVRNGVKTLIKQLWLVYPVNKLFTYYLMEGLKSKNARQRAECLEAMALTIANHGLNICIPTPQACLKEIAKQLSDRDNSVRNGALNCAVQAYYIVGEKIFKMVGNISDKDMSLLEERIKRASKKPPPQPIMQPLQTTKVNKIDLTQNINIPTQLTPTNDQCDDDEELMDDHENDEEDEDNLPEVALPSQVVERESKRNIPNPYQLDSHIIQKLDSMREEIPAKRVEVFDLNFLKTEVLAPSLEDARARVIPVSPPKPILPTEVLTHTRQASAKSSDALAFERHMQTFGGTNIAKAIEAVTPLEEILRSNKGNILADYEDKFITALSHQLFNLHGYDPGKNTACVRLYRNLLTLFELFFAHPKLGRKITTNTIKLIISEFLKLLVEDRLDNVQNKDSYIRVLNLHCVKLIERADHTNCICALIQFLHECVRFHGSCRLTDIVMKCLWRVIKIMPTWEDDIDCDRVLLDIHNFFKEFPTLWWKNKPSDTPIRTIKTILHSIAKVKGASLTEHLANIPNINDSELEMFIHKMIRSLKLDEVKQVPLKTESRKMLPRSSHAQLQDIFQKIGSKEETKEGLNLLYDFLQQNPESDIDPFLQRSSQFFQEYIQKNLKEIENERKNPTSAITMKN
ncbi:protein mini spindles isoform X2 [Atheta coriaria]|uniref:protein mini spindles isoform X2 n=1 Tax=Dalotia coriaria TaxID=877792 RepID=UPI0031F354F3